MRISDWSSDVCSSDLAGPSAWPMSLMHRSRSSPPHAAWRNRARSCLGAREAKTLSDIWQGVEARAARFGSWGELPSEGTFRPLYSTNDRSEEHTSELQSLMRISYAVFCLKKKKRKMK